MGTALITGASSGIGLELAKIFAKDGHDLVLVARREDRLNALAEELDVNVTVIAKDLTKPDAPKQIFDEVDAKGIEVDFLVNNAGFGSNGPFHALPREREVAQIQLNVMALVDLSHLFLQGMVERNRGRILNIASTAGFQAGPYMAVYYATKAFVISFSEGLSYELTGTGVTVTAHCPGATATEFAEEAGNDKSLLFKMGAATVESVAKHAYRSMMSGKVIAVSGLQNLAGTWGVKIAPRSTLRWFTAKLNR